MMDPVASLVGFTSQVHAHPALSTSRRDEMTYLTEFYNDESGQGITEYGAILAFVALLVAVVFGFAQGTLQSAISQSFSRIVSELNRLNTTSS
jgi:Flp pilus assembly pilin Flp